MASKGIHSNHKKDTQHAWLYCAATIMTLLVSNVATYLALKTYRPKITQLSIFAISAFFTINTTKSLLPGIPVTAFIFLLHHLHKRFAALNAFLR